MNIYLNAHSKTARIFLRAVFFIIPLAMLLNSCSQKYVKPAIETPRTAEPLIRVALDDQLTNASFQFLQPHAFISEEAAYEFDKSLGDFSVQTNGAKITFKSKKRFFSFGDVKRLEFSPADAHGFRWNGKTYHGKLIFLRAQNRWMAINEAPMSAYLKGVVPHEIPSGSPEYYQAVIAQSIAARSYANYHIHHPANPNFDVYADTRDQVYGGLGINSPNADRAVAESFGLILVDAADNLVETQYHSTCGGQLEPRAEYHGSDGMALEHIDFSDSTFNCTPSPLYRWTEIIEANDILANLLSTKYISSAEYDRFFSDGYTLNLTVMNRLISGRVSRLSIELNDKRIELREWDIRRVLTGAKREILPSTFFFLKQSQQDSAKFFLIGAGFGHGRGLCQWGAIGQSLKGGDYREILKTYYPQLKIKKLY